MAKRKSCYKNVQPKINSLDVMCDSVKHKLLEIKSLNESLYECNGFLKEHLKKSKNAWYESELSIVLVKSVAVFLAVILTVVCLSVTAYHVFSKNLESLDHRALLRNTAKIAIAESSEDTFTKTVRVSSGTEQLLITIQKETSNENQ